jgi:CheY-like chemotaxis protein
MIIDKVLAEILLTNKLLAEKDLRNALERQKNIEEETLEESLIFLGVANYALLGKAYELHYQIPYYPVFHQGADKDMLVSFSPKAAVRFLALPVKKDNRNICMTTCQPEDVAMQSEMNRIWKLSEIQWRVASQVEMRDAVQKYCFNQEINRERRGLELPFDFKIIDFQIAPESNTHNEDHESNTMESSSPGKRIILVEPDHKIRNALKTLLLQEGYRVTPVVDENEAIKELEIEDAMYLLKRRIFQSHDQRLESFRLKNGKPLEVRHYGALGGILLGAELSSEQIFRTYLSTVKLLLARMTWNNLEIKESCDQLSHYAKLLATSIGMNRKSQEALQLAIYLKEIGRYLAGSNEQDTDIFSIMPILPYEQSSLMLAEIEDNFSLAEIIAGINRPLSPELHLASKIITMLLAYFEVLHDQESERLEPDQLRILLGQKTPGLLDEELVNQLVQIVVHEQRLAGLGGSNGVILIIDSVFERDHGDLYQELTRENYEIVFSPNVEQALSCLRQQEVVLIVSEMAGDGYDGMEFCRSLHHERQELSTGKQIPFVFFTAVTDEKAISAALLAGADDVIARDSSTQVAFLKFSRLIKQYQSSVVSDMNAAGVSGSLDEMGFMETVQILANRSKDALIKLRNGAGCTASVYLHNGEIIHAATETLSGEAAIYEVLTWRAGFFQVATPDKLPERNVFGSTEAIMLEGCRLMDEESRESFG